MLTDDPAAEIQVVSHTAGLALPENRLAALAIGARTLRTSIDAVLAIDLGASEPASRFRPPPSR